LFVDIVGYSKLLINEQSEQLQKLKEIHQLNFQIKAAISFEQFWQLLTEMSETLREKMAGLAAAQLPAIKQAVADAARKYFVSGTMSFPAEALIVIGRKSAA
jgi:hypothetical protein